MKIAVWGAGSIGKAIVYRLVNTVFTSEIHWYNQTVENITHRTIDIEHGLTFAPTCSRIIASSQDRVREKLMEADILVLTIGKAMSKGEKRLEQYSANVSALEETIIPAIEKKEGLIVLVITNPLDLITRYLVMNSGLPQEHIFGLGTVVDTARLRYSIAQYRIGEHHPSEIEAYAIGPHDDEVIAVVPRSCMAGEGLPEETQEQVIESCRREICKGADRVKHAPSGSGSLHPVVEGAIDVLSSVVLDRRRIHTVSVPDPKSKCCLCYSMPCRVGRDGVLERMIYPLDIPGVREKMDAFIKKREADIISNI